MDEEHLRQVYEFLRDDLELNISEVGELLGKHWPPDDGDPWSATAWYRWARGELKLRYEARVALHRYLGLEDPPQIVNIPQVGEVELLSYSAEPQAAILIGNETEQVTIRQTAPLPMVKSTQGTAERINVVQIDAEPGNRKQRKNISFYDLSLVKKLRLLKIDKGVTWDALLCDMLDKYLEERK